MARVRRVAGLAIYHEGEGRGAEAQGPPWGLQARVAAGERQTRQRTLWEHQIKFNVEK